MAADPRVDAGRVAGRASWLLADQALSSVTNFALIVLVARHASVREFGAFSLLYGAYTLALQIQQAAVGEPLLVLFSGHSVSGRRVADREPLGAAVALGIAFGILLLVAAPFTRGTVLASVVILAVSLPGLLLQDSLRLFNVAKSRPRNAFLLDAGWAVGQGALTAGCLLTHHANIADLTLAWTGSGVVAGVVGLWLLRVRAAPGRCLAWFRSERRYIGAYLTETLALSGSTQLSLMLVAAVSGLVASAGLRGVSTLFGPLNIVLNVARQAGIHELARLRQAGRSIRGATWLLAVIAALVALAYGGAIMVLPGHVGRAAFGKSWAPISALVTLMTLYRFFMGLAVAPFAAARVLRLVRKTLVLRIGSSVLTLALSVVGAVVDGARGTVVGMIVSAALTALLFFVVVGRRPDLEDASSDRLPLDVEPSAGLASAAVSGHAVS